MKNVHVLTYNTHKHTMCMLTQNIHTQRDGARKRVREWKKERERYREKERDFFLNYLIPVTVSEIWFTLVSLMPSRAISAAWRCSWCTWEQYSQCTLLPKAGNWHTECGTYPEKLIILLTSCDFTVEMIFELRKITNTYVLFFSPPPPSPPLSPSPSPPSSCSSTSSLSLLWSSLLHVFRHQSEYMNGKQLSTWDSSHLHRVRPQMEWVSAKVIVSVLYIITTVDIVWV